MIGRILNDVAVDGEIFEQLIARGLLLLDGGLLLRDELLLGLLQHAFLQALTVRHCVV